MASLQRAMKNLFIKDDAKSTSRTTTKRTTTTTKSAAAAAKSSASVVCLLMGVSKEAGTCCYLWPYSTQLIDARCVTPLDTLRPGELYDVERGKEGVTLTALTDEKRKEYLRLGNSAFTKERFGEIDLRGLALGCQARTFDEKCATVESINPLILAAPERSGYIKKLRFKSETGEYALAHVQGVNRNLEKQTMTLYCSKETVLPASVGKGTRLEFMTTKENPGREPILSRAMTMLLNGRMPITNWRFLEAMLGKTGFFDHERVSKEQITMVDKNSRKVAYNPAQSEAIQHYTSSKTSEESPATVVEAAPGTGKTRTGAAMIVAYGEPQLVTSTANVPMYEMASAISELKHDKKILHLASWMREAKDEIRSPYTVINNEKNAENVHVIKFKELRELFKATTKKDKKEELLDEMKKAHDNAMASVTHDYDVIIATLSMALIWLLKKTNSKKPCRIQMFLKNHITRILIDEASQMTEAELIVLSQAFAPPGKTAPKIFAVGDSKQLPPFKYQANDLVSELAARSALEVLKRRMNVPVVKLNITYRHEARLMPYNPVFYGGKLKSGLPPTTEVLLKPIFGVDKDCMFVKVKGSKANQSGTSKENEKELAALEILIKRLLRAGFGPEKVSIIAYYEAQRVMAKKQHPDYELLTVDSAQGREKDIVIVLTTRDARTDAEFFTSDNRCNVAVSRHKKALIVVGSEALLDIEPWKELLEAKIEPEKTVKYFSTITY